MLPRAAKVHDQRMYHLIKYSLVPCVHHLVYAVPSTSYRLSAHHLPSFTNLESLVLHAALLQASKDESEDDDQSFAGTDEEEEELEWSISVEVTDSLKQLGGLRNLTTFHNFVDKSFSWGFACPTVRSMELAVNNYQTLRALYFGSISTITNNPGTSTYTRATLKQTIAEILTARQPDNVRTLDYLSDYDGGDHSDHLTTARLVKSLVSTSAFAPSAPSSPPLQTPNDSSYPPYPRKPSRSRPKLLPLQPTPIPLHGSTPCSKLCGRRSCSTFGCTRTSPKC
ncbi:hypothetical protein BCR35DRAFT_355176 [Leucosporidium creatinivorum]|uniref:Uncharacterized protein n=1 Tax=Leucosporidium creatinivorum TaxID=106004 RepID=A0A1Y2DPD4_9BASI|nr:hypothetical protein BCR35DRAFT_355176 [Leucosporidium creatinivorum]